jgi:hypothetical protein
MSVTATVLGAIARRYAIQVDFLVAHTYAVPFENVPRSITSDPDVNVRMQAVADGYENGMKTQWPEWFIQDTNRAAAFTITAGPREDPMNPDIEYYDLALSWPVNAAARITVNEEGTLTPEDEGFPAWAQGVADAAAAAWLAERPFTPL